VQIGLFACSVPVLMRLPLARVQSILEPRPAAVHASTEAPQHILDLVNLVLDGLRPVLRPTCLTRGVTRCFFLRRAGLDVSLAFGISPTPGIGGHCWLERAGQPFLESRDPRPMFALMYRI
jgi:hypothetical protein